jgi:regulator of ribonuclease activity A
MPGHIAMSFKTSDLIDEHPEARSCESQLRMFGRRRSFSGRIRTVRSFEDNALARETLSRRSSGEVLVIDGEGSLRCALVGDMLATLGMNAGWSGVIVNGAVRDTVALDQLEFGVRALGTNPKRCGKAGAGQIDVPVSFGGLTFTPGDWLYCDEDGIVVSQKALV